MEWVLWMSRHQLEDVGWMLLYVCVCVCVYILGHVIELLRM